MQKEPSNPGGEPANLLPSFLQESSPIETAPASPLRVKALITCALRRAWMVAHYSSMIELSQKYSSSPLPGDGSFLIPLSEYADQPSRLSTPSGDDAWVSQPNTLSSRHSKARTLKTLPCTYEASNWFTVIWKSQDLVGLDLRLYWWTSSPSHFSAFTVTPNTSPFDVQRRMDQKQ